MNRLVRYLKRVLLALALLVTGAIMAGIIYLRTDSFGRLLKDQVSTLLTAEFRGDIELGQIDTSVLGAFRIHQLIVRYAGRTIIRIPQIDLSYSLIPLLWREARVAITLVDPVINLQLESDGEWNLMKALASKSPAGASSGAGALAIVLDRVGVRKGEVDIAPEGAGGPHYRFEAANLDGAIAIEPAGLRAELSELQARVVAPGVPLADLRATLSYGSANGPAKVKIKALRLTTQASAVSITGVIRDVNTLASDLVVTIDELASSDLSRVLPNYPLREAIRGRISLKGTPDEMRTEAELAAGNAGLHARLQIDLTRKAPPFTGELSLARLDLGTLALPQKLAGTLDMSVKARGKGMDLQTLFAETSIKIAALRAGSTNLGHFDLIGGAENGNVQFNGDLSKGPEHINLNGSIIVIGNPRYEIAVETKRLNAAEISQSVPSTDLNCRTAIRGSGSDLQRIVAKVDFRAVRSAIAGVPIESEIRAQLKAGVIDISQAQILSQGTTISLTGRAGIVSGARTQLSYRVRADRIGPWLKLTGNIGDGSLMLDGTASGTLRGPKGESLRGQGKAELQAVHFSNLSVASGSASYNFEKVGQAGWPRADAKVHLTAMQANGMKLRAVAAQARLDGGRPPHISIAIAARDEDNNSNRLTATVVYEPDQIAVSLDELILMLPDGTWHLAQRAQVAKDERHLTVSNFALANGARRLALDADIASAGAQRVELSAHAIDLAILRPLMPQGQRIAGDLSAEIMISGTFGAPLIRANLDVSSLAVNSQKLGDVNATANYRPSTADLDATLHQDRNHQLRLSGDIPVSLSWTHGFAAAIGNNQKMRVYTAGIRLAPFSGIAPRTLRNVAGLLQADLGLTGPPLHPAINGTMAITGAGGDVVPIGIKVTDFETRLVTSPTSIEIAELSAKAADGTLSGSGSVALHNDYSPGAIKGALLIHQWPAIATARYNATIDGEIQASGTPDAPVVQGKISVIDTTIHPDLDFLSESSVPPPDNTIVVVQSEQKSSPMKAQPPTARMSSSGVSATQNVNNSTLNSLAVDLKVDIHRNTWIRHQNAQVELDGGLNIKKRRDGPISVVGEIDTVRGWLRFHGKRFTLENGQILFTGGSEIDPNLNIDAQYTVSTYIIDVIVAGKASAPEIKLKSQPQLTQADILSLILFGTTTSQLGQGQKMTVQQQAQSLAAGAAGQALSESLGLSSLGVDVSGQSVGFGRYINENTYLSLSPKLSATGNQIPSQVAAIQYFLWRWLTITTATMSDGSKQVLLKVNKRY
jgi:autotransporter translocation and assembly factor TamB